jgi:hypothetical protein
MTRTALLREIKDALAAKGYRAAPGTNFGATALLFRRPDPDRPLLLLLAIQFSRAFDDAFTGHLCVSRTLRWAYRPLDCPSEMSVQVAELLTPEERSLLLDDELCQQEPVLRGWWRGFRRTNAMRFIEAVETCEPRLLSRQRVLQQVEHSPTLCEWSNLRRNLVELVTPASSSREAPRAPIHVASSERRYSGLRSDLVNGGWVDAAERISRKTIMAQDNPVAFVRSLAQESWTLHQSGIDLHKM